MVMVDSWPLAEGRYKVGNKEAPVAVCTLGTLDIDMPMDNISIKGKCVIENIGIEKVVRNIVSNPNIRFLILCGNESKGHFTGQALKSLKENGVNDKKRIIGAKGAMPFLRGLSKKEVETFRQQVEVVDLIGEFNPDVIAKAIQGCVSGNPGPFKDRTENTTQEPEQQTERITAEPSDRWEQDPKGFFIININREKGEISAEHYTPNKKLQKVIVGKQAADIYKKIDEMGIVSLQSHAFYLGKELAKAELALRGGKEYIQD